MGVSVDVLMGSVVDGNETEIQVQERVSWGTNCWGCGLRVVLPRFAPMFRCGWCGAITMEESEMKPISPWSRRCSRGQDRVFVGIILLVIVSIVCGGIWATFPVLFPTATVGFYVHSAITAILSFNTLFNFCMAAFTLAGPSPTTEYGKYDLVGRKSLEGYKFCVYCKRPKPPNAHHCRSCESCVVEMDHHCPFIGNFVGSNNLHYFLLFLVFAMVSGFYLFGMTLLVGSKVWPNLMKFRRAHLPRLYEAISFDIIAVLLASMIVNVELVASIRACVLLSVHIIHGTGDGNWALALSSSAACLHRPNVYRFTEFSQLMVKQCWGENMSASTAIVFFGRLPVGVNSTFICRIHSGIQNQGSSSFHAKRLKLTDTHPQTCLLKSYIILLYSLEYKILDGNSYDGPAVTSWASSDIQVELACTHEYRHNP